MNKKGNLSKIAQFWVIPLLCGAYISTGYSMTQRIWISMNQGELETNNGSPNVILKKKHLITSKTLEPSLKKTNRSIPKESSLKELKESTVSTTLSNDQKTGNSLEEAFEKTTANTIQNDFASIERGIKREEEVFKKLFESLPDP